MSLKERDVVEELFTKLNRGEYYVPPLDSEESGKQRNDLCSLTKRYFRNADWMSKYGLVGATERQRMDVGFYVLKRLTEAWNLCRKSEAMTAAIAKNKRRESDSQVTDHSTVTGSTLPSEASEAVSECDSATDSVLDDDSVLQSVGTFMPIGDSTDGRMTAVNWRTEELRTGDFLISHPMACVAQSSLYRRVIYLLEVSEERVIGIALNNAFAMGHSSAKSKSPPKSSAKLRRVAAIGKKKKEEESGTDTSARKEEESGSSSPKAALLSCHYLGGPVPDESTVPFHLIHNCRGIQKQFPSDTVSLTQNAFWTNITVENSGELYNVSRKLVADSKGAELGDGSDESDSYFHFWRRTLRNIKSRGTAARKGAQAIIEEIKHAKAAAEKELETEEESAKERAEDCEETEDATVVAESDGSAESGGMEEELDTDSGNENGNGQIVLKTVWQYAAWNPSQLRVELSNGVWFAARVGAERHRERMILLECDRPQWAPEFNKWMWSYATHLLGAEYRALSHFPYFNPAPAEAEEHAFVDAYLEVIASLHSQLIPEADHSGDDDTDDDDGDDDGFFQPFQ